MSEPLRAPPGTHDVLYPESARWEAVVSSFASLARRAGYGLVINPIFEDERVFLRGMGTGSDVASKEMYRFEDRGGRRLALRPEGTASVVRAFVQHRPATPWKAWYVTPAFRYERPQAGRYRQHHQIGVEAIGSGDPDLDTEVIALAWQFYADAGVGGVDLRIGSMGDASCRPAFERSLRSWLEANVSRLCNEHRARAAGNPLRVLDCKTEECRSATESAPLIVEALCAPCAAHFARVREGLDSLDIPYVTDPRLVRGFDYYTRTTFELSSRHLDAAQNGVGGGGRYDGLVEALGGPPSPAVGFGIGIERLLLAREALGSPLDTPSGVGVFVVDVAGGEVARRLTHELRAAGIGADRAFDGRSLKAQMRLADRSGAEIAVIVGPEELAAGKAALRHLRGRAGDPGIQEMVDMGALVERVSCILGR